MNKSRDANAGTYLFVEEHIPPRFCTRPLLAIGAMAESTEDWLPFELIRDFPAQASASIRSFCFMISDRRGHIVLSVVSLIWIWPSIYILVADRLDDKPADDSSLSPMSMAAAQHIVLRVDGILTYINATPALDISR